MKQTSGRISISRAHPQKEEDYIIIEVVDQGYTVVLGEMSLSDFSMAITGHGNINIDITTLNEKYET